MAAFEHVGHGHQITIEAIGAASEGYLVDFQPGDILHPDDIIRHVRLRYHRFQRIKINDDLFIVFTPLIGG